MIKIRLYKILSSIIVFTMIMMFLPTLSYAVEKTVVYTNSEYVGMSDGTKNKPYANFEDAVKNVAHGGTVYIINKGFINTQDEHGVLPYVIDKNISIIPDKDNASLIVRAGGIILNADVKMENIELNFANKYRNSIFLNGNKFKANNVTRGSGSREVHLICGAVYDATTKKLESPTPGTFSKLIVSGNSEFGNIYAGSLNGNFDGNVDITITAGTKMVLGGSIYASGADETKITTDDWFDVKEEPKPPTANNFYELSGKVNITMNTIRVRYIDGAAAKGGTAITLSTEYPYDALSLNNISELTVSSGTIELQSLTASQNGIKLNIPMGSKLNLKNTHRPVITDLYGGGTIVIDNSDTLTITGNVTGVTAFETAGGFGGKSGIAQAGFTYIVAPNSEDNSFTFAPFSGQNGMTLSKDKQGLWTTSNPTTEPVLAESFCISEKMIVSTLAKVNEGYGEDIPANWTATTEGAWLSEIPINYEVEYEGEKYNAEIIFDEETSTYSALIPKLNMEIIAYEQDFLTVVMSTSFEDIQPIKSGIYHITASTVSKSGKVLTSAFTIIVIDENAKSGQGAFVAITNDTGDYATKIDLGSFSAKAIIPQKTNQSTVMIAKYMGNKLLDIKISSAVATETSNYTIKETESIFVSEDEVSSGVKLKAFIFENLEKVNPLCSSVEI